MSWGYPSVWWILSVTPSPHLSLIFTLGRELPSCFWLLMVFFFHCLGVDFFPHISVQLNGQPRRKRSCFLSKILWRHVSFGHETKSNVIHLINFMLYSPSPPFAVSQCINILIIYLNKRTIILKFIDCSSNGCGRKLL